MGLTSIGAQFIAAAIIGAGTYTDFNNANAYLGVGNGNTAFSAAQTDLVGASSVRVGMDASYPTRSTATLTFKSTFGSAVGNFAWEEWGVFNHASAGQMLVRYAESLGTKVAGATWEFTVTLTFS